MLIIGFALLGLTAHCFGEQRVATIGTALITCLSLANPAAMRFVDAVGTGMVLDAEEVQIASSTSKLHAA